MKKRFLLRKCLLALGMVASVASASSCSAFFGGDEFAITDTNIETDENGNTIITITFSEDVEPLTFTIPSVINGEDGNGIDDITASLDDGSVTLTIHYTDENKEDTVLTIPVLKGDSGVSVVGVNVGEDELGNTTLEFEYSNGEVSELITIPKGKDGADGNGISNIEVIQNHETGVTLINITFTDPDVEPLSFTVNDGVSIIDILYNEELSNDENYVVDFYFSDGSTKSITFPRPQSNNWYSGANDPSDSLGKSGDFYLNISNGNVYRKINDSTREFMFCMKGSSTEAKQYYYVSFNLSDGEFFEDFSSGSQIIISIEEYKTVELNQIPIPQKDGFVFLGWYDDVDNPNSGRFDSLTPVTKNISLYARWSEI